MKILLVSAVMLTPMAGAGGDMARELDDVARAATAMVDGDVCRRIVTPRALDYMFKQGNDLTLLILGTRQQEGLNNFPETYVGDISKAKIAELGNIAYDSVMLQYRRNLGVKGHEWLEFQVKTAEVHAMQRHSLADALVDFGQLLPP